VFSGRFPFYEVQRNETVIIKVVQGNRPSRPAEGEDLGLSDTLWDLTQDCWATDLDDRPIIRSVLDSLSSLPRRRLVKKPKPSDSVPLDQRPWSAQLEAFNAAAASGDALLLHELYRTIIRDTSTAFTPRRTNTLTMESDFDLGLTSVGDNQSLTPRSSISSLAYEYA
jgi:hypothetical protein